MILLYPGCHFGNIFTLIAFFFSFHPCPRLLYFSTSVVLIDVANVMCAVCVLFFEFVTGLTQC